jgi:cytochrome c biogenesis protein CcmG, thiol:disulfide interchange protein DsbE
MRRLRLFLPLIVFAVLAVLLWRGLALDPNHMPSALEDRPLPEFTAASLAGGQLTRSDLLGQVALLNVWATWCPSCAAEHAYLNELAQAGVAIFGINYKDEPDAARRWLAQRGDPYRLNILDESGRLGLDLGVTGAPETYLIDAAGIVRLRHQGPLDARVWREQFRPLIDGMAAGAKR